MSDFDRAMAIVAAELVRMYPTRSRLREQDVQATAAQVFADVGENAPLRERFFNGVLTAEDAAETFFGSNTNE